MDDSLYLTQPKLGSIMDINDDAQHISNLHPRWNALIRWLSGHGMDISTDKLLVVARASPGAGYGLFTLRSCGPSEPLLSVPAQALMNTLTLSPHYPAARPKLSCTQIVSLHLMLYRPIEGQESSDPLFGPYISVLPRDFDYHPFTWFRKRKREPGVMTLEDRLVEALPRRIVAKLDKMSELFGGDWARIQKYIIDNPEVRSNKNKNLTKEDYLWGWLNVNTRCVYHRLAKTRSDQDNMTLCPILDFANHSSEQPCMTPKATRAEIWDTVPSRKFGDNFVLLSPSDITTPGTELYLRYGVHSNATLFSEYGFVNRINPEAKYDANSEGEVELGKVIEDLFEERGTVGTWMKQVLIEEGYWGDWTLHASPPPAHPSYRLITTLRLYHSVPISGETGETVPSNAEDLLQQWRDTTLGKKSIISEDNEARWRKTLKQLCKNVVREGMSGFQRLAAIDVTENSPEWLSPSKAIIETLWREDVDVGTSVVESLQRGEEF